MVKVCVTGVLPSDTEKLMGTEKRKKQQGKEGSLSFAPTHEYKTRAVTHKVGKKIPQKKKYTYFFHLHSLIKTLISLSLLFIYFTSSHLEHPDNSSSNTPTNLCSPKMSAQALALPEHPPPQPQQGENCLQLYRCLIPCGRSIFPLSSSAFHSPLCTLSADFLSQQKGRTPLRAAIWHTKYTWDAKCPSSAEIGCGWIIL